MFALKCRAGERLFRCWPCKLAGDKSWQVRLQVKSVSGDIDYLCPYLWGYTYSIYERYYKLCVTKKYKCFFLHLLLNRCSTQTSEKVKWMKMNVCIPHLFLSSQLRFWDQLVFQHGVSGLSHCNPGVGGILGNLIGRLLGSLVGSSSPPALSDAWRFNPIGMADILDKLSLFLNDSVYLYFYLSIYVSVYLSIYLSV